MEQLSYVLPDLGHNPTRIGWHKLLVQVARYCKSAIRHFCATGGIYRLAHDVHQPLEAKSGLCGAIPR